MILITNDDGINAKGIRELAKAASKFDDVLVFAPDSPRSGMSCAITFRHPLKYASVDVDTVFHNGHVIEYFMCNGTPVDCLKIARMVIIRDRGLNHENVLVLSGINHGSNVAVNAIYSGTIGACMEAAASGYDTIGFSLCDWNPESDFTQALVVVEKVLANYYSKEYHKLYENKMPNHPVCLNVNIPVDCDGEVRLCRWCRSRWIEDFAPRDAVYGGTEYVMAGEFVNLEPESEDTDVWALEHGYASVVPLTTIHEL